MRSEQERQQLENRFAPYRGFFYSEPRQEVFMADMDTVLSALRTGEEMLRRRDLLLLLCD
jgi:hypothetical protein